MPDFLKSVLNVQPIDLNGALPVVLLIALVALILLTLVLRSFLQSRVATAIMFAVVIIYGSSTIVGGIEALTGLLAVTFGGLALVAFATHRWPTLLNTVRELAAKPQPPEQGAFPVYDARPQLPPQAHTPQLTARTPARKTTRRIPPGMGFGD